MGLLTLPKDFHPDFKDKLKNPVGLVEIDWLNPLSKGLAEVYLADSSGRLVGLLHGASESVGTQPGHAKRGSFVDRSEADSIDGGKDDWIPKSGRNMSIIQIYATTDGNHTVITRRDGGSENWHFFIQDSAGQIQYRVGGTANTLVTGGLDASWFDGKVHTIGLSVGESSSILYKDGIQEGSAGANGVSLETSINLGIGNRWAGYPTPAFGMDNGNIYAVFLFNRSLSEAEQKSLHFNPYQILKPSIPASYFIPSGVAPSFTIPVIMNSYRQRRV
jgi:hypothetical protein